MSSSSAASGGAGAASRYFCHQCDRTVLIIPTSADISCPICHGGFLEEFNLPSPNPNPTPTEFFFSSSPAGVFTSGGGGFMSGGGGVAAGPNMFFSPAAGLLDFSSLLGSDPFRTPSPNPAAPPPGHAEPFNPLLFFQTYMNNLVAGGANVQVVFEGAGPGMGSLSGASLGDYFVGPGLEQLIQQLAENDPNRYGTPPASKSIVDSLPDITISDKLLASDEAQCAVCKDTFEIGETAKQIPCKHIYHKDCIVPWLELHNSCPVCRFELPTDDAEYEQRKAGGGGGGGGGVGQAPAVLARAVPDPGAAGGSSPGTPDLNGRTVERRFRISLPWPFSGFGAQGEGSGGDGSGNGSNQGGSGGSGPEHRQEDLD